MTASTSTLLPAAFNSITLARTGLVDGRPALIGFDTPKSTVLLVGTPDGSWTIKRSVAHGGIRGMGMLVKDLDADTARPAGETPVWEVGTPAAVEPTATVEEPVTPVADHAPVAPVETAPVEVAPEAPAPTAKVAEHAVVSPVLNAILGAPEDADLKAALAACSDVLVLRNARDTAIKGGAKATVVRSITLRAGEVACGMSLATLRKVAAPAKEILAKMVAETKPEANGKIVLLSTRLHEAGIGKTAVLQYSYWKGGPGAAAAAALNYHSGLATIGADKAIVLTPKAS
jgi:hypothetical protein